MGTDPGTREGLLLEMAGAKEISAPDPLRLGFGFIKSKCIRFCKP